MSKDHTAEADILLRQMPWIQRDEALRLLDAFGGTADAVMRHLQQTADASKNKTPRRSDRKVERHFVGGGPSSGQAVLAGADDDDDDRHGAGSAVNALFEQLRRNDAGPVADGDDNENNDDAGPHAFFGSGRRLGHTTQPSPVIASTVRQTRTVVVAVYRNGYRIDSGPLLPPNNSAAVRFFRALQDGVVPEALSALYPATQITLKLSDFMNQEYTQPAYTAFAGEGHRLSAAAATNTPHPTSNPPASQNAGAVNQFELHENEEKTKLAIVNLLGERKEFTVNPQRHTVGDVFALAAQQAQPGAAAFQLIARDFPPRPLVDKSLTIDAAKLRNATVIMRPLT